MTSELRAVLFDMDGLLVNSEPLWFEAECAVMSRMGGSWTRADQAELTGSSLAYGVEIMRRKAPRPADPVTVGRWLVDGVVGLMASRGVALMTGAAGLLAELTAAQIPRALVTSAQREIMDAVLTATGLGFGVTVCGEDVSRSKPDPEAYLRAAALLGENPAGCVVLEDSPRGIAAAGAAGCPVIAVPSVPLPAGLTVAVAPSLREVDLAKLREVARVSRQVRPPGEKSLPPGSPVTEKS
jgi:HAD superfamily hydrolase (TIGR01509 family)